MLLYFSLSSYHLFLDHSCLAHFGNKPLSVLLAHFIGRVTIHLKVPTGCFSHQLGISVLPMLWSIPSWNSGAVGAAGAHELRSQTGLNPSSVIN